MRALDLFKGRHFDRESIVLCVLWYLTYKLSSRDSVPMMAERGVEVTHTRILRSVQRFVPAFEQRWSRYSRPVGWSWRCDETYTKVMGRLTASLHRKRLAREIFGEGELWLRDVFD
jgi:transposase-like protein